MKALLSALFGCQHELSWPITTKENVNGFKIRKCYRVCVRCGSRVYFDPKKWENIARRAS